MTEDEVLALLAEEIVEVMREHGKECDPEEVVAALLDGSGDLPAEVIELKWQAFRAASRRTGRA